MSVRDGGGGVGVAPKAPTHTPAIRYPVNYYLEYT